MKVESGGWMVEGGGWREEGGGWKVEGEGGGRRRREEGSSAYTCAELVSDSSTLMVEAVRLVVDFS